MAFLEWIRCQSNCHFVDGTDSGRCDWPTMIDIEPLCQLFHVAVRYLFVRCCAATLRTWVQSAPITFFSQQKHLLLDALIEVSIIFLFHFFPTLAGTFGRSFGVSGHHFDCWILFWYSTNNRNSAWYPYRLMLSAKKPQRKFIIFEFVVVFFFSLRFRFHGASHTHPCGWLSEWKKIRSKKYYFFIICFSSTSSSLHSVGFREREGRITFCGLPIYNNFRFLSCSKRLHSRHCFRRAVHSIHLLS